MELPTRPVRGGGPGGLGGGPLPHQNKKAPGSPLRSSEPEAGVGLAYALANIWRALGIAFRYMARHNEVATLAQLLHAPTTRRRRCGRLFAGKADENAVEPANAGKHSTVKSFRVVCLRELKKIKRAWPDLHYQTVTGALVLLPSPPRIPPAQFQLISG